MIVECKAILFGVQLAHIYGSIKNILEMDCEVLINCLTKKLNFLHYYGLFDVMEFNSNLDYVSWMHVRRGCNGIAYELARLFSFGSEQVWKNYCLLEVSSYVFMDKLSLNL